MPLRYVGRYPDTEGSVSPRSYASAANDKTKITTDFINKTVDAQVSPLTTTAYVDQQDALKASKAAVTAADENYFPQNGHGLGTFDAEGYITASQIPNSVGANRPAAFYTGTASISTAAVGTSAIRGLLLATVTIPDPGWAYTVVPFAWVTGYDPNGVVKSRWSGTGNTGKAVVMQPSGNDIYGWGICTGSSKPSNYPITPAANAGATPKLTGGVTLNLYGSVMTEIVGQTYTFSSPSFFVVVLPATA